MLQAFSVTAYCDIEDLPVQNAQFVFRFCSQFKDRYQFHFMSPPSFGHPSRPCDAVPAQASATQHPNWAVTREKESFMTCCWRRRRQCYRSNKRTRGVPIGDKRNELSDSDIRTRKNISESDGCSGRAGSKRYALRVNGSLVPAIR